jgi:hypothetical protein
MVLCSAEKAAEADRESSLLPLRAASCTYRLALGRRAGQKVLSLQSLPSADKTSEPGLCAKLHGFTLHAAVRWGADQRQQLEHLCRYITRPAIANERLKRNRARQVVLQLKRRYWGHIFTFNIGRCVTFLPKLRTV